MNRRKTGLWVLLILLILLLVMAAVLLCMREAEPNGGPPQTSGQSTGESQPGQEQPPGTSAATEATAEPEATTLPAATGQPGEGTTQSTKPSGKSQPEQIVSLVLERMAGLAGTSEAADSVPNGQKLSFSVSAAEDVTAAADKLLWQIQDALQYDASTAYASVPSGNPNPFSYRYALSYTGSRDGQHYFQLAYRFISPSYTVSSQGYTTGQLVADVCAHLNDLGKSQFDSRSASGTMHYQSVVVLMEHDYETVLEMVKAQVESATRDHSHYDFYYKALTIAIKGSERKDALLFCIYTS